MANANVPKGFSPVGTLTGTAWNEQGRLYAIATDSSNTYAIGDVVMSAASSDANGIPYVQKWGGATTTSALPLGIIVGIRVADPGVSLVGASLSLEKTWIGKSAGTRYVYVVDDPNILFEAQFDSTGAAQTNLHQNAAVTITADDTTRLTAGAQLSGTVLTSPATTATLPIRLLGAIQRTGNNAAGATTSTAVPYVAVLCKWNFHELGVTAGASGTVPGYLAP
jgi:hypothetical protein